MEIFENNKLNLILQYYFPNSSYSCTDKEILEWFTKSIEQPTKEKLEELFLKYETDIKLDSCKSTAKEKIEKTDWIFLSDVKIENKKEILEYRKILRNLILKPVENPIFPDAPEIKVIDTLENLDLIESIKRYFKK